MSSRDNDRDFSLFNTLRAFTEALVATALAVALMYMLAAISHRHPSPTAPDLALRGSLR